MAQFWQLMQYISSQISDISNAGFASFYTNPVLEDYIY